MNTTSGLQFLRPYLCQELSIAHKSAYIRFYNTTRALAFRAPPPRCRPDYTTIDGRRSEGTAKRHSAAAKTVEADRFQVEDRVKELQKYDALRYPRIKPRDAQELHFTEIKKMLEETQPGDRQLPEVVELRGRVRRIRISGQKLFFLDIIGDGHQLQAAFDYTQIEDSQRDHEIFRQISQMLRRGDVISVAGNPVVFKNGQRGVFARSLPVLLSPSLASLPTKLEDPQTRIRNRHADLLVNKPVADRIRLRSIIMHYLRTFLLSRRFVEVQTPIIADKAGGAIARPFTTVATEFSDKQLSLRVAPEIWLKRLVLGGLDRVFEIGPAFRNEGLDATHNPEFTTCEFYEAYADLEALMSMTERLIFGMSKHIDEICVNLQIGLPGLLLPTFFKPRFERLEFLPTIEARLKDKLPDLSAEGAQGALVAFFLKHEIPLPASPTLPKLLDKLSALYIEPECEKPTFIMHHPACMAPLAKSFLDPTTNQELSARAELFIKNKEIANMYEEENSPFEQRRKFLEQAKYKDDENKAEIDESYLEALEWGLPPTGGWGCGIDRLCMLMTGAERINDVLTFGSLKNVVSLNSKPGQDVEPAMKSPSEPEEN